MIGDCRAPEAPPVDSLAECVVLNWLVHHPDEIGRYAIGPLLHFREHQDTWRVLVRTFMRGPYASDPYQNYAGFVLALDAELERAYPQKWRNYLELLDSARALEYARAWEDATERPHHEPGCLVLSEYQHGFDWWLARLQAIAEARRGIRAAQRIAEGYWQVPERPFRALDAHAILRQFISVRDSDVGMEVPV